LRSSLWGRRHYTAGVIATDLFRRTDVRANREPVPLLHSGRVHPKPFFQQIYAFTQTAGYVVPGNKYFFGKMLTKMLGLAVDQPPSPKI
jgi:hypothetical protein